MERPSLFKQMYFLDRSIDLSALLRRKPFKQQLDQKTKIDLKCFKYMSHYSNKLRELCLVFFFFLGNSTLKKKLYRCPGIVYITGTLNSDGKIGITGPYK